MITVGEVSVRIICIVRIGLGQNRFFIRIIYLNVFEIHLTLSQPYNSSFERVRIFYLPFRYRISPASPVEENYFKTVVSTSHDLSNYIAK